MIATKRPKRKPLVTPENIVNDEARVITESMIGVGECYAQGDLYFVRLANLPASAKVRKNRQLAEGNTQGSRHVCEIGEVWDADPAELSRAICAATKHDIDERYLGPVICTAHDRVIVTHPEHADHDYRGNICLAVVFQRSLDSEDREQRVQD